MFKAISLEELNKKSALLQRIEHKFLGSSRDTETILSAFEEDFYILEIDGNRCFTYNTIYFDTKEFEDYYQHHQGKRLRKKVRTRLYEESGKCFFEVKLKQRRRKIKKRIPIPTNHHGMMGQEQKKFFHTTYHNFYHKDYDKTLIPSIQTRNKRITLVHKTNFERVTFDFDIQFATLYPQHHPKTYQNKKTLIIEIKSPHESSCAKKILTDLGKQPIQSCSKYCLGMNFLDMTQKHNTFKQSIKKIAG